MNDVLINRLLVLAETRSFSRAAECLFISRTALTQQVSSLEKELGFQIFDRTHEGIVPTKIGIDFLNGLDKIYHSYENLVVACRENAGCVKNTLVIGTISNFPSIIFPGICAEFKKTHPETQLVFKDFPTEQFFQHLANGNMDISVEYMEAYHHEMYSDIEFFHLMKSKYYCAVSFSDELARKNEISFSDLRGRKLMMYQKGISVTDDLLREYLLKNEPEIQLVDIENYSSSMVNYCHLENIVVLLYANHHELNGMKTIATNWDYQIPFGIAYKKKSSRLVTEFLEAAKKYIHNI